MMRWVQNAGILLRHEKKTLTFHYTGCLIGILTMVYSIPHITRQYNPLYPKQPGYFFFSTQLSASMVANLLSCWRPPFKKRTRNQVQQPARCHSSLHPREWTNPQRGWYTGHVPWQRTENIPKTPWGSACVWGMTFTNWPRSSTLKCLVKV